MGTRTTQIVVSSKRVPNGPRLYKLSTGGFIVKKAARGEKAESFHLFDGDGTCRFEGTSLADCIEASDRM